MGNALVQSATIQLKDQGGGVFGSKAVGGLPTSLTLTGSGFGAIVNPRPTAFDTFNDYPNIGHGDEIPRNDSNPYWTETKGPYSWNGAFTLDNEMVFGDRQYSIKSTSNNSHLEYPIARAEGAPIDNGEVYATWWIRFNENQLKMSSGGDQPEGINPGHKLARIWDHPSGDGMRLSYGAAGQPLHSGGGHLAYPSQAAWTEGKNQWHRIELSVKDYPSGSSNVSLWVDGKKEVDMDSIVLTGTHSGSASTTTLTDSTASFTGTSVTYSEGRGCLVRNITDGSEGITTAEGTPTTAVVALTGGTTNQWNNGDVYEIVLNVGHWASGLGSSNVPYQLYVVGFEPSDTALLNDTLRTWIAEFYQSPTRARVELSNSIILDDSVNQERVYQAVAAWSDTEIVIPNRFYGNLDQSQPIYAHVITADETVYSNVAGDVR